MSRNLQPCALLVCLIVVFAPAQDKKSPLAQLSTCSPPKRFDSEKHFEQFTIRIYQREDVFDSCIEVLDDGRAVFSQHEDGKLVIGNGIYADEKGRFQPPIIPLGTDITGRGKPNVIVWNGAVARTAASPFTF